MNIAEALVSAQVSRITAASDPNTVLATQFMQDMSAKSKLELDNLRIDTQVRLQKLISEEQGKAQPNTRLVDAWQSQVDSYANQIARASSS